MHTCYTKEYFMKTQIQPTAALAVMPVTVVATQNGMRANFAPHGQCSTVCASPPVIALSVIKEHETANNIIETGTFSINIPSEKLLPSVLYCGSCSGKDEDKSEVFSVFYGNNPAIPLISECPVNLACKVLQKTEINGVYTFFAEVTETLVDNSCLNGALPSVPAVSPFVCSLDGKFWAVTKELTP